MTQPFRLERNAIFAFLLGFLSLQLIVSFRYNLNWDEYYFLSHIYAASDGRLADSVQRFHVNLLFWIRWLPFSEPDQLVAGRQFMMLCEAGGLFCLYRICREFTSPNNALFAVAAWCSAGSALLHGASFRADPLASFLMMSALALMFCGKLATRKSMLSGAIVAVSVLITVKSLLYFPAFFGALYWQASKQGVGFRTAMRQFAMAIVTLAAVGVALFLLHSVNLADPIAAAEKHPARPKLRLGQIFDKVIMSQELFPRAPSILQWLSNSILPLALCAAGLWHATTHRREAFARWIAVLALLAPLASLVIYRNAFPYFFPFIMYPAAIVAGIGASRISNGGIRLLLIAGLALTVGVRFAAAQSADQSAQREISTAVHQIFSEPVTYVDRNGMIPSFPKSGFFMSSWGMEDYREGRTPSLRAAILRDQAPLIITNSPWLEIALRPQQGSASNLLLPEDVKFLQENYLRHWGHIWVAGKTLNRHTDSFDVVISGTYTLDCDGIRTMNNQTVRCGDVLHLDRGRHSFSGDSAQIRWGNHLFRPTNQPTDRPVYYGL